VVLPLSHAALAPTINASAHTQAALRAVIG